jgi:hypothetical protein
LREHLLEYCHHLVAVWSSTWSWVGSRSPPSNAASTCPCWSRCTAGWSTVWQSQYRQCKWFHVGFTIGKWLHVGSTIGKWLHGSTTRKWLHVGSTIGKWLHVGSTTRKCLHVGSTIGKWLHVGSTIGKWLHVGSTIGRWLHVGSAIGTCLQGLTTWNLTCWSWKGLAWFPPYLSRRACWGKWLPFGSSDTLLKKETD